MDKLVLFEAAVLLIALLFAFKPKLERTLFRLSLPRKSYRVGFWLQLEEGAERIGKALADSLQQSGVRIVALHPQAAGELYRNMRWRDRIGWHEGALLDMVAVGRVRSKPTNDVGNPYMWVLDFRYFYPQHGAPLNSRQLTPYIVGTAKAAQEILKALWLMKTQPAPEAPAYPYDTTSWPQEDAPVTTVLLDQNPPRGR